MSAMFCSASWCCTMPSTVTLRSSRDESTSFCFFASAVGAAISDNVAAQAARCVKRIHPPPRDTAALPRPPLLARTLLGFLSRASHARVTGRSEGGFEQPDELASRGDPGRVVDHRVGKRRVGQRGQLAPRDAEFAQAGA